jgi:hypothetical protein
MNLGLRENEINRLARYYESRDHKVDYGKFMEQVEAANTKEHDLNLYKIAQRLDRYLK